jgi:hypothetical protein
MQYCLNIINRTAMKERIQEFTEFIDHNLLIIRNISTLLVTTGVSLIIYDLFKVYKLATF